MTFRWAFAGAFVAVLGITAAIAGAVGSASPPAPSIARATPIAVPVALGVVISLDKELVTPEFRRSYTARLANGVSVKLTAYSMCCGDRSWSGEADQPDGRWILFDPDNVADKIVDPAIVALVQNFIGAARASDAVYMSTPPSSFIDWNGVKWTRADPATTSSTAVPTTAGNLVSGPSR